MNLSIGIIAAERSMERIQAIDSLLSRNCEITYLPYTTLRHLRGVYEQNIHRLEGVLFSGRFPYEYIVNHLGRVQKPCAYFELTDRDYYRIFLKLLVTDPTLDIRRVLIESPLIPVDFSDVFGDIRPVINDLAFDSLPYLETAYERALAQALQLWDEKKIDVVVTRFANIVDPLRAAGIPVENLFPSPASMLEVFNALCTDMQSQKLTDSMAAFGIVSLLRTDDHNLRVGLKRKLAQFNAQNGMALIIRGNGDFFEIVTANEVVRDITEHYTNCLLTGFLHAELCEDICIGWGIGADMVTAQKNAQAALRQSQKNAARAAYLVDGTGKQFGPLLYGKSLAITSAPPEETERVSKQLGISPQNLHKLVSLQEKRGLRRFTSADLAFYLNITLRSANRILAKLVQCGGAEVVQTMQSHIKGRPYNIYEVNCRVLFSAVQDS